MLFIITTTITTIITINIISVTTTIISDHHDNAQTGHTALQRAAAEGHVDIVKQLVKQGASVDHQDEVVSVDRDNHDRDDHDDDLGMIVLIILVMLVNLE